VRFNGDDQCQDFIATQISTELNANSVSSGIELVFENDKLIKAFDLKNGKKTKRDLKESELGLQYVSYPLNPILKEFYVHDGKHQLGGEMPDSVEFPENDCAVGFQYLGYISIDDENFGWLPSTIHLMCPIFLGIDKVFLDYSDPNKPVLINREEVESINTAFSDLNKESKIVYNSRKFDLIPFDSFGHTLNSGIPNWMQYPTYPKCPKSGKRMKFLCQIFEGVSTKSSNIEPVKESYRRYYEKLNFWGDGDLYVFIQPEEKTVCYFIQNT